MPTPRAGIAVRGSISGRPIMAAMDLLGRRWALRTMWELRAGPLPALELRARCDQVSSSVLYQRLRELSDAGLVRQREAGGYALTPIGSALGAVLEPLDRWARPWSRGRA